MSARKERLLEVTRAIQEDARADAMALDGQTLNGRSVGENFGKIFAAIDALARAVEHLASEAELPDDCEGSSAEDTP